MKRLVTLFLLLVLGNLTGLDRSELVDFVAFTQPKTGTHLLFPILEELSGKSNIRLWQIHPIGEMYPSWADFEAAANDPNNVACWEGTAVMPTGAFADILEELQKQQLFLVSHVPHTHNIEQLLLDHPHRVIFVLRDPRDVVVSAAHFYGRVKDRFMPKNQFNALSLPEKITVAIKGGYWSTSIRNQLKLFKGWVDCPHCCVIDFAQLVSESGYLSELRKIADFIGVKATDHELRHIYKESFGKGWTFRSGKTGAWREHFTPEHKKLFKEEAGDLLIELGFESDNNW